MNQYPLAEQAKLKLTRPVSDLNDGETTLIALIIESLQEHSTRAVRDCNKTKVVNYA